MNSKSMVALVVVVLGLAMVGPALAQHHRSGGWDRHRGYHRGSSFSFGWGYSPVYRTVIVERPVERVVYTQPAYSYYPSSSYQPYYAPTTYYTPTTYCSSTYYATPTRYYEPATRYYSESRQKVRLRNGLLMGAAANEIFNNGHSRHDIRGGAIAATLLNEIFNR